jgi:DNA processing protein
MPWSQPFEPFASAVTEEVGALVALTALAGMGPRRLQAVLDEWPPIDAWQAVLRGRLQLRHDISATFGGRLAVWLQRWTAQAPTIDPAALLEACRRLEVTILAPGAAGYPERLRDDPDRPHLLYARGDLQLLDGDAVAVVGTRAASAYGLDVAFELGAALAGAGVVVVSGLATGIDGSAHRGALSTPQGCGPIGVVGSGLDVVYPRAHARLWEQVAERGLLLSEAPPGVAPEPWRFPSRNRIIAALSRAVVVVESPESGGSMITADEAIGREIPVLAVPGSIRSPVSAGPHRLIFDGCGPARGANDVLGALGRFPADPPPSVHGSVHRARRSARRAGDGSAGITRRSHPSGSPPPRPEELGVDQQHVLDALGWEPSTLDDLIERTGLPLGRVALIVEELDQRHLVRRERGFVRRDR